MSARLTNSWCEVEAEKTPGRYQAPTIVLLTMPGSTSLDRSLVETKIIITNKRRLVRTRLAPIPDAPCLQRLPPRLISNILMASQRASRKSLLIPFTVSNRPLMKLERCLRLQVRISGTTTDMCMYVYVCVTKRKKGFERSMEEIEISRHGYYAPYRAGKYCIIDQR